MSEPIGPGLIPILNNTEWQNIIKKYDVTFTSWKGRDGDGFEGTLKIGTQKIATFRNEGNGGETVIHRLKGGKETFTDTEEYTEFLRLVEKLPKQKYDDSDKTPLQPDDDTVLAALTDIKDLKKTARKVNKENRIVFVKRVGDQDQLVEWTRVVTDGTQRVPDAIRKKIKKDNPNSYFLNDLVD